MTKKHNWQTRKLGEVCEVIAGQSPEGKFYNKDGKGLPFYQGKKEFSDKFIGEPTTWTTEVTKEAIAGDILMSVRAPVGPVNFATEKICIGRGLAAMRPSKFIDKDFLFNFLQKHENEIVGNMGAVFNSISKTQIEDIDILLPPLPEQQRLVKIIDRAFAAIEKAKENAEKNLQNAKEVFEAYLQSVFANTGDGWSKKSIGDACVLRSGTTLSPDIEKPCGNLPYLKVADMNLEQNKVGVYTSSRFVNKSDINENGVIPVGSTIFPKRGGAILTNKKRLTTIPICMDLNLMAVTPKKEILPEIVYYYFLGLDLKKINNGSSIPQINNYQLEPLTISFPKAITGQQRIVTQLDALSAQTKKLEAIYQKKIADLEELKKSLLQKAFSGKL